MSAESQASLPKGWTHVRFGDVVRNKNLTTKDPEKDGLDRIVGLTHLDSESLPIVRWDILEGETSFSRTFAAGDVLFGKRRAYQRKVGVPDFAGICSGDILVFESKDPSLLQEFLPYIVQSDAFFERAVGTSAGSLSPRTNWGQLARFEFALPPIEEQNRIREILSSIKGLRALLREGLQNAQNLKKAQLEFLFDPTTGDKTDLRNLADFHNGFPFKPRDLNGKGLPVVRIRQLLDPQAPMDQSDVEVPTTCMLSDGDLVFAWSGTLAVRRWTRGPAKLNQHLFRVVEHSGVSSAWLQYALEHALGSLSEQTHGTAMKHITKAKLLSFAVRAQSAEAQEATVSQLAATDFLLNSLTEEEERLRVLGRAVRERMLHVS